MEEKVALITGSGKRMGRAIALQLASFGYSVALHHNTARAEAADLAAQIGANGGKAVVVEADLADAGSPEKLIGASIKALGRLDLLVNNAAIFQNDTMSSLDRAQWRRQFAINLEAPVFLSAAFAKSLPASREGSIVNVIDNRVLRLTPQNISYTLAKSALWTATQTMAQAFAPRIRVNAVGPGPTFPNASQGEAGLAHEVAGVLLQRRVLGRDVGEAVVYLASARSVTGQFIAVDSGQHLAWRTPDIIE